MATAIAPSPVEAFSVSALERNDLGESITRQTIENLARREETYPGTVSSVVVLFRQCYSDEQWEFLLRGERNQSMRERRYQIAEHSASAIQCQLRRFLYDDPSVAAHFDQAPNFHFNARRHVEILPSLNALIVPATHRLVERIWQYDDVLAVEENFPLSWGPQDKVANLEEVITLSQPGASCNHRNGYTWGWNRLKLPQIHAAGFRGKGVCVGIANSGVFAEHPDLIYKVKDFARVQPPSIICPAHSFDRDGHGTHTAGTIVGADNSGVQIGGAPEAELKAVSVLDRSNGVFSALLTGLEWFTDPYRSISVVNLSVGFPTLEPVRAVFLEAIVFRLSQMGILCVAAIGNNQGIGCYPARFSNVLAAGALDLDDEVWAHSADGPNLVLPGVSVYSSVPYGLSEFNGQEYVWRTGTSTAAAHLTGLVVLLMQSRHRASVKLLFEALVCTASKADAPDERAGHGVPDFFRARDYIGDHLADT